MKNNIKVFSFLASFVLFAFSISSAHAQTFTFGAAGDYANGGNFQAVVSKVKVANTAFQLVLGDMAYSTVEQSWCNTWNTNGIKPMIVSGNHDSGESSAGNINTYIQYCPNTLGVPLTGVYGKQYYFDYPSGTPIARFIMIVPGLGGSFIGLDTNYSAGSQGYNFTSAAIDDARAKGIKWIIVGMHKNYISAMEKGNELGADLIPMLINKKVDLILQGHEHGYERSKQLTCARTNTYDATCVANSGNSLQKGLGTVIDVIGTGGQGLRALNTRDTEYPYFAASDVTTYGFGKFVVSPTQISYNFVPAAGGTFTDSFTITEGTTTTPTPTPTTAPTASPVVTASPTPTLVPSISPTVRPSTSPSSTPTSTACPAVTTGLGEASYTVTAPNNSTYFFWLRMMSAGDSANSVYVQVDNNCPVVLGDQTGMASNSWQWVNYMDGNTARPLSLNLSAGDHAIKIIGREANVKVDKFLLLATACTPVNFGDNCLATPTVQPTISPTPSISPTFTASPMPSVTASPLPTTTITPTPTPSPVGTTTGTIRITDDASVNAANKDYNYGDHTIVEIDGGPQRRTVYMKFDATGVSGSINSALLKLKIENPSEAKFYLREVSNNDWSQRTVTYTTRPAVGEVITTFTGADDNTTKSIDITSYVRAHIGRVFTIEIDANNEDGLNFYSIESTKKPVLELH